MSRTPDHDELAEGDPSSALVASLLASEREAPPPAPEVQARMWSRLSGSLSAGRPFPLRTMGLAALALAGAGALLWSNARPTATEVAVAQMTPPPAAVAALPPPVEPAPVEPAPEPFLADAPVEPAPREPPRRPRPRAVDTLGVERRLIDEAREALSHGEPKQAEQVLAEHARRFPRGQLREERESLLVRTELTLGRIDAARARAAAFLAAEPGSLFAPIVRALDARARGTRSELDAPRAP